MPDVGGPPSRYLLDVGAETVEAEAELGVDGGRSRASFRSKENGSFGGSKGPFLVTSPRPSLSVDGQSRGW